MELGPKKAIVWLTWKTSTPVLLPVDEDFEPDHWKIGEGLTPEQIEEVWRLAEESNEYQLKRGMLSVSGWTKRDGYYD